MRNVARAGTAAGLALVLAIGLLLVTQDRTGDAGETARGLAGTLPAANVASQSLLLATATEVPTTVPTPTASPTVLPTVWPTATPIPVPRWVDPAGPQPPWVDEVEGVLTFRGSPSRSYYGEGPVPVSPSITWSYPPRGGMCGLSTVGEDTSQWCGLGWTGQPAVWERDDGLWVAFGAYDHQVHVLDGATGEPRFAPFRTGDIIKGSVTVDPDGYPLMYIGSRDNFLRILSWDSGELREVWSLDARSITPSRWNDDWDGSPLVIDDYLFEGGENSNLHIVRLNRGWDDDGHVVVAPEVVVVEPGWDDELLAAVGSNVSIEGSVTIWDNTLWFANSGGLVQGWDIAGLADGVPPERVFRFWMGDDTDATIVVDDEGFLYAAAEFERGTNRSREVGQLVKLDPSKPDDPVVWSFDDVQQVVSGIWATPAITDEIVYASTHTGRLLALDRYTGDVVWERTLPAPLWSSQVVVDDVLLQSDCTGVVHAYDVSDPRERPDEMWSVLLGGGCIEATPVVWRGRVFVGSRGGQLHMLSDG